MVALFKNKLYLLLLLPFAVRTAPTLTQKYVLRASQDYTEGIKLSWSIENAASGDVIEIQRSLHPHKNYLVVTQGKKKISAKDTSWVDKDSTLKLYPDAFYDYRIRIAGTLDWSAVAKGAKQAAAAGDLTGNSLPCRSELSLNKAIENQVGEYTIHYSYSQDCMKPHSINLFLSEDKYLNEQEDTALQWTYKDEQVIKARLPNGSKTQAYHYLFLKIGNQLDNTKIIKQ